MAGPAEGLSWVKSENQVRLLELRKRIPGVEPVEQCFSRLRAAQQGKPSS